MSPPFSLSLPFASRWYSSGLGQYRPCNSTYCATPYESLPPLPPSLFDPPFHWLTPLTSPLDPQGMHHPTNDDNLTRLMTFADHLQLTLPASFIQFFSSPELMERIPSCTDCYFRLPNDMVPCPGSEHGDLIAFMIDSQGCLIWYLYLAPQQDPCILVSGLFLEEEDDVTPEEASDNIFICAHSFEEFLYRFWVENRLWFDLHWGQPLHSLPIPEQHYLSHYLHEKL